MNNHIRTYINETMDLSRIELQAMKTHKAREYDLVKSKIEILLNAPHTESVISICKVLTKEMLAIELEHMTLDYCLERKLQEEQENE